MAQFSENKYPMKLHRSTSDTGNEVYEGFHLRKSGQLPWYAHLEDVESEGAGMMHPDLYEVRWNE